MKCVKCGMVLPDDSEFCQYCGAKIEQMASTPSTLAGSEVSSVLSFLANNAVDNINANSRITEKHTSDPDYGLVPEKPVFTFLVDGAEDYLNGLVSENNEELTWSREGSMPVTGVSGPVDIYASRKKNGQPYNTLYVSIYGKANSTAIPKGFARKGSVKSAPVEIASEHGADRNTIAKASIGFKNKRIPEDSVTNTSKTETPLQTQQQEMLYEDSPNTIQENIPVLLEKVSLYHDPQTGNLVTKCAFRSLTEKSLLAMLVNVRCTDVWGTPTDSVEGFQYLDLRTTREMIFGQDKKIPIPNPATRFVEIEIKKVIFADRSLAEASTNKAVLPAQQPLLSFFGSEALTNEYLRETGIDAQNTITEGGGYWRCTCGAINDESESNCYRCTANKSKLLALQNIELISANLEAHQKEMQEKADQERAEREAFRRQTEEKERLEREERERKSREAAEKYAEEMRVKKEQRQKRVKRISIIAAAISLCLLAAYAVIWHIVPSIRYNNADSALSNKQFDTAYEGFLSLGSYKDSEEKAKEAIYQKGFSLMDSGKYTEAATEFSRVSEYKDSSGQKLFCENQVTYLEAAALFESGKYAEAAEAFRAMSGFSDSENKANEASYLYAQQLLEKGEYEQASKAFQALGDYEDSKELKKESDYLFASKLLDQKNLIRAYNVFESLSGYKDSVERAKESKYLYALNRLDVNDYEKAIDAFKIITGYKDVDERLLEAQYNYALVLSKNDYWFSRPDWEKASGIFLELGNYKDSKEKYKETYYQYGLELITKQAYDDAVDVFESLENYEDSKTQLKEAKYRYVLAHRNGLGTTTYEYLKDLKAAGYKDSSEIYKSLYSWHVTLVMNDNENDSTTNKTSISKYGEFYCHVKLAGGPPGGKVKLKYALGFPDGNWVYGKWDWEWQSGFSSWCNGYYETPAYGATGTFRVRIYDQSTGELLGEASIRLT